MNLFERASTYSQDIAIVDGEGEHTYAELLQAANRVAGVLLQDQDDLRESRVAFMIGPSFDAVAALWGIWMAGGIAVPLCITHPRREIEYVLNDASVHALIFAHEFDKFLQPSIAKSAIRPIRIKAALAAAPGHKVALKGDRRALILYTSGTTGQPKGAVATHANIAAQITCLVAAWEWRESDRILLVLPLHHTHGLINVLSCALWAGATCDMMPGFEADGVWRRFMDSTLTVFMAVPTIYVKLIAAWQAAEGGMQRQMSESCKKLRLMVSGSAALPVKVFDQWQQISGHTLLERYGMTEIGMALSNPLRGERRRGFVGLPLPGVEIRRVDDAGQTITAQEHPGELYIRSPSVFLEYWNRPDETEAAFDRGWFKTGDIAVRKGGYFRILGRSSVDIIKTAGFKVSALEIEEILTTHPRIQECSIVGVPDQEWGERVCAACVTKGAGTLSLQDLRTWAKEQMAPYKVPSRLVLLHRLPRNAMGKVTKPRIKALFDPDSDPETKHR